LRLIRHDTSSFKTDSRSVAPFKPDSRSVTRGRLYARPFEAGSKLGHPKPTLARSLHGRPLARAFETYSSRRSPTFSTRIDRTQSRKPDRSSLPGFEIRRPRPISVARTFKTDSTLGYPKSIPRGVVSGIFEENGSHTSPVILSKPESLSRFGHASAGKLVARESTSLKLKLDAGHPR